MFRLDSNAAGAFYDATDSLPHRYERLLRDGYDAHTMRCDPPIFVLLSSLALETILYTWLLVPCCINLNELATRIGAENHEVCCSAFGGRSSRSVRWYLYYLLTSQAGSIVHHFPNHLSTWISPRSIIQNQELYSRLCNGRTVQRVDRRRVASRMPWLDFASPASCSCLLVSMRLLSARTSFVCVF